MYSTVLYGTVPYLCSTVRVGKGSNFPAANSSLPWAFLQYCTVRVPAMYDVRVQGKDYLKGIQPGAIDGTVLLYSTVLYSTVDGSWRSGGLMGAVRYCR